MKLFGPVFWYDLVRIARRQRLALWRAVYGLVLLTALFLLYATALPHAWLGGRVNPGEAAAFAGRFFAVFSVLQFAAVILLTPAWTATALAEEKSHNTLVFLLTTHLTNREIVLGKLFTRLLQIGLLVLTGLPVLGVLQLLGGVEPRLVLATFAALGLTALSLGGLGLVCAIYVRKPQNAAWRAYQILFVYVVLSLLSVWYWSLPAGGRAVRAAMALGGRVTPLWGALGWTPPAPDLSLAEQVISAFNIANPYYSYLRLAYEQEAGSSLEDALPDVLRDFALAHGLIALLLVGVAVLRLRAVAARQIAGLTVKKAWTRKPAPHPPVRERPVLWKEIYCEARPRQRWLALFFTRWFFVASFLPAWVLFLLVLDSGYEKLASYTTTLLRFGGTLVAAVLCLRVALHAARSIGQERDRQTLDNLLTTDLEPAEIVRDKWWGSLLSGRWVLVWLLVHWGLGVLSLALHPLAVPLLLVECLVFGACAAGLGMFCAARYPTTRQAASAAVVVALVGSTLLPWIGGKLLMVVLPEPLWQVDHTRGLFPLSYGAREVPPWPDRYAWGLSPVRVFFSSVVRNDKYFVSYYYSSPGEDIGDHIGPILLGLVAYAFLAVWLARRAVSQFERTLAGGGVRRRRAPPEPPPPAVRPVGAAAGWGP